MSKGQKPGDRAPVARLARLPLCGQHTTRSPGLWLFCARRSAAARRLHAMDTSNRPDHQTEGPLLPRPSLGELIAEIERLAKIDQHLAAMSRLRTAFEAVLRARLSALSCPTRGRRSWLPSSDLISKLHLLNRIGTVERHRLDRYRKVLSKVGHGEPVPPTWFSEILGYVKEARAALATE